MSISLFFAVAASFCCAQQRQVSSGNPSMPVFPRLSSRTEIILPKVNGLNVIKVDFHVHTFFSDGNVSPTYRVTEAWEDGLDALAITDHIEYRPTVKKMIGYLSATVTENKVPKDTVAVDLNFSVRDASARAKKLGITLIPGAEITRNPVTTGHFNALFTTDNNLIPAKDALDAIRNAKKQGALVQSNHPGWRRENNDFTDVAEAALAEHLIDGVEVFNTGEAYPDVIETAVKENLYICSNTDIHETTYSRYGKFNVFRNMTLVFAKDASPKAIRKALESRKTLAYSYGDIAGQEQLLKDFFTASVSFEVIGVDEKGTKDVKITNNTSFDYVITIPGKIKGVCLKAFSSIISSTAKPAFGLIVDNMWFGPDKHPFVEVIL